MLKKFLEKKSKFLKKGIDFFGTMLYNGKAVWDTTPQHAAIAQQVERILGKDEVASSNLASSSKTLKLLEFRGFFVLRKIIRPHPFSSFSVKGCVLFMRSKIYFPGQLDETIENTYILPPAI